MASEYSKSTQAQHWVYTRSELDRSQDEIKTANASLHVQQPLPPDRLVNIYIQQQIIRFGKRFNARQQALATAQVYIKRYLTKCEIRRTNVYLLITAALYLASKMEESPIHIKTIVAESIKQWPDLKAITVAAVGECEFSIISTLQAQMIVHHPYRNLLEIGPALSMTTHENALAWSVINDHYNTDLALLYCPQVIAMTAVFVGIVMRQSPAKAATVNNGAAASASSIQNVMFQGLAALAGESKTEQTKIAKLVQYIADSDVDIQAMVDIMQELISLYYIWDNYSERAVRDVFVRLAIAQA